MRTVTINVICDQCGEHLTNPDAAENLQIKYKGKTYEVDICHDCIEQLVAVGRVMPRTKAAEKREFLDNPLFCKVTGCGFLAKTKRGLSVHLSRQHSE